MHSQGYSELNTWKTKQKHKQTKKQTKTKTKQNSTTKYMHKPVAHKLN